MPSSDRDGKWCVDLDSLNSILGRGLFGVYKEIRRVLVSLCHVEGKFSSLLPSCIWKNVEVRFAEEDRGGGKQMLPGRLELSTLDS